MVMDLPITSSAEYPKIRSAPLFQLVMMPSSVLLIMASSAEAIRDASQYGAISALFRLLDWDRSTFSPLPGTLAAIVNPIWT